MREWLSRIRDWLRRDALEAELREEMQFHRAQIERDAATTGADAPAASVTARRRFGHTPSLIETARERWSLPWLDIFLQDVRISMRALRRAPAFSVTVLLTLTLGIAATITMFTLVNGVLLKRLPYGDPNRLVMAWHEMPGVNLKKASQARSTYYTYKRHARTIEGIAAYLESQLNVAPASSDGEPERAWAVSITRDLFDVLQLQPLLGRTFTVEEDRANGPDAILIGERFWRTRFRADPLILGRTVEVSGVRRTIVGVVPERLRFPRVETQFWLPLRLDPADQFGGGFTYVAVARLRPGVTVAAAQRDFAAVLPRLLEAFPLLRPGQPMQALLDQAKPVPVLIPLHHELTGSISRTLAVVSVAAALLLLVACANVINLILVRADARSREMIVREALGAGRARLLTVFLSESLLLAIGAGALGLGVAGATIAILRSTASVQIPRLADVHIDAATWLVTAVVVVAVAAVCSVIPALRTARSQLATMLREGGRGTAARPQQRLRGALVTAQMAVALVMLASSGLLIRSAWWLGAVKPGFDARNVTTVWVSLPGARYRTDSSVARFHAQLVEEIARLPGVRVAGLTSALPLTAEAGNNQNPLYPEDDPTYMTKIPPLQGYTTVSGDYFRAMGIPVIAGRTFGRIDAQSSEELIISRKTAVQFWNDSTGERALGKRFKVLSSGAVYSVVGVVGDVRDTSLAHVPQARAYFPQAIPTNPRAARLGRTMAIVVRTADESTPIIGAVQQLVRSLDPSLPTFRALPMDDVLKASMARLSFTMAMLSGAAAITVLLGSIGLYGILAYAVRLRTRELCLRVALGASPGSVARMVTGKGLRIAAIGIAAGLAGFALVARFLGSFLYGVAPIDPVTIAAATLLLVTMAILASWFPARRALRVNPAVALRAE